MKCDVGIGGGPPAASPPGRPAVSPGRLTPLPSRRLSLPAHRCRLPPPPLGFATCPGDRSSSDSLPRSWRQRRRLRPASRPSSTRARQPRENRSSSRRTSMCRGPSTPSRTPIGARCAASPLEWLRLRLRFRCSRRSSRSRPARTRRAPRCPIVSAAGRHPHAHRRAPKLRAPTHRGGRVRRDPNDL